jgi:hypothetical protein
MRQTFKASAGHKMPIRIFIFRKNYIEIQMYCIPNGYARAFSGIIDSTNNRDYYILTDSIAELITEINLINKNKVSINGEIFNDGYSIINLDSDSFMTDTTIYDIGYVETELTRFSLATEFEYGCYHCSWLRINIKRNNSYTLKFRYSIISEGNWEQKGSKLTFNEKTGLNQYVAEIVNDNRLLVKNLPGINKDYLFHKCERKNCKEYFPTRFRVFFYMLGI